MPKLPKEPASYWRSPISLFIAKYCSRNSIALEYCLKSCKLRSNCPRNWLDLFDRLFPLLSSKPADGNQSPVGIALEICKQCPNCPRTSLPSGDRLSPWLFPETAGGTQSPAGPVPGNGKRCPNCLKKRLQRSDRLSQIRIAMIASQGMPISTAGVFRLLP